MGMDLTELQTLSGFLMNETPDYSGHFYPPWAAESDPIIKDEPMVAEFSLPRPQQQELPRSGAVLSPDLKIDVSSVGSSQAKGATVTFSSGTAPTLRKTASGGITRRRSSSKEEQAKKRRERNRVLARRTRLRKKFFFQSLQQQVGA